MSKHFGGGRRLEDKVYAPRRGVEDKRPSVFDRLGVREYDESPSPSHSHAHYAMERGGGGGGGYRRTDGPAGMIRKHSPSPMNMVGGRRNHDPREKIRSRSRSRSFSPRSRRIPAEMTHHGHHAHGPGSGHGAHNVLKKTKPRDPRDISPQDHHRLRPRSNSPMRRKMNKVLGGNSHSRDPSHNLNWRDNIPPPSRHKPPASGSVGGGDRIKSKKMSSGKPKSKKGKSAGGKEKSTSGSSGSSGETSTTSRSASSSSSTSEGSSSSTSNASSSSDSSVPSIKLKHDRQNKRKKTKKPSSKGEASTGQIQNRISSGSSIESGNVRDNRDLREKIKAKNRQNYEKIDGPPSDVRMQRRSNESYGGSGVAGRNYTKHDMREHTPSDVRRRRSSGAGSYEDGPSKRRRLLSPEDYVPSPRRAPPPNDAPHAQQSRRERTPPQRDRMRTIQSPMRRAPLEDRRMEPNKRMDNYADNKHRDLDRYRDEGQYGRGDNHMLRQKDRLAPARPPMRHPVSSAAQTNQDQRDRDRSQMETPGTGHRFESRHRPLLHLPPAATPPEQMKMPFNKPNSNTDERVARTSVVPQSPGTQQQQAKHSPMIVKSKEALIEKYRGMKQSQYVDMWVDKTVEACIPPGSSSNSTTVPSPVKDSSSEQTKFEKKSEVPAPKPPMADIGELLSDFSDDEELLNKVGDDKSVKSDNANCNTVIEKEKKTEKGRGDCETEASFTPTTAEMNTQSENKNVSPAIVTASHDRKVLETPQRSFSEVCREGHSLPSRSQTEDDILERMDFEEISDEELGDVGGENKIPIVDALGVDWASLVCGEKIRPCSPSSSAARAASSTSSLKVRERWTPLQVISRVGVISNCSGKVLQDIVKMKMKDQTTESKEEQDQEELEEKLQDELQNAGKARRMRARANVIDTVGLGPNSRALSSRRDMALRRYYLGMPQKSLVSMDMLHQNPASNSVQDMDSIGELYRLSLSLFKGSETISTVV